MVSQIKQLASSSLASGFEELRLKVIKFRKLLAHEDIHPYLEKIVSSGVLPVFVQLLELDSWPELQFECAWILTNIAAGSQSQTRAVVESEAVVTLIRLLSASPYKEVREQCVWCLGNIAGDSAKMRQQVIDCGALDNLIQLISSEMNEFLAATSFTAEIVTQFSNNQHSKSHNFNVSTLRIAIWALSNFCRGHTISGTSAAGGSALDWDLIDVAMPILSQVITCCAPGSPHADDEIIMDSCWALSRILRGIHEGVERVIVNEEVCSKLGLLICHSNSEVQVPALRCLINIVSGCDAQTQVVIDAGLLKQLHRLLTAPSNETVRKEACLIISNITAGLPAQVEAVVEENIFPSLVDILRVADFRTKREACWAIANATLNKILKHDQYLLEIGVLEPLLEVVLSMQNCSTSTDDRVTVKIMEAIGNVLDVGAKQVTPSIDNVLDQLSGMCIDNPKSNSPPRLSKYDSAYSSMTSVFIEKNYFSRHFSTNVLKSIQTIAQWQSASRRSQPETITLARNIISVYFPNISL